MTIKSNPYVYPYTPFADLSKKKFTATFKSDLNRSTADIQKILTNLVTPPIRSTGKTSTDILNFFLSNPIRFGPKNLITDLKPYWEEKLNFFISQGLPIVFTILGFPFKIPVPIKTNRTCPDLGELLSLYHLNSICQNITKIYPPGAIIHVYAEGVFGKFNSTSPTEYYRYKKGLDHLVSKFILKHLVIHDLDEMESLVPNFGRLFVAKVKYYSKGYENHNPDIVAKYIGTFESIYRIANTRTLNLSEKTLMDVYYSKLPQTKLSSEILRARKHIQQLIPNIIFNYLAYLSIRDDIQFLENSAPHGLNLTVSPKKYRLGIQPISPEIIRLPYHGVPVFHLKTRNFSIEYLIDLKRTPVQITPIHWSEDIEHLPFYYQN